MKCPICDSELNLNYEDYVGNVLCEQQYLCFTSGLGDEYDYEYGYGAYKEIFFNRYEFIYTNVSGYTRKERLLRWLVIFFGRKGFIPIRMTDENY